MASRKNSDTPLMRQFLGIKSENPDAILFFRLGDFYEMFYEDAVVASEALDLTLTSRDKNSDEPIPMCGVPHHSARGYIARLVDQGHKVAICEQVEDPKKTKKLVKRAVVRIITPGMSTDEDFLDPKSGRYVACAVPGEDCVGLSYLDISTGEFRVCAAPDQAALVDELVRVGVAELLLPDNCQWADDISARVPALAVSHISPPNAAAASALLSRELGKAPEIETCGLVAAAATLTYARDAQRAGALPVVRLQHYSPSESVVLDEAAVRNLELVQTMIRGQRKGSLLDAIDVTKSAMGARKMRRDLLYPLIQVDQIRRRHDAVEYFVVRGECRDVIREALKGAADIHRIVGRVSLDVVTPKDLGKLRDTLARVPNMVASLAQGDLAELPELLNIDDKAVTIALELSTELARSLVEQPPASVKEGGFIADGYCERVDEFAQLARGGRDAVLAIETRERETQSIPNLKVKYNRVFGYFIEVSKSYLDKVPKSYTRKQTIANAERYVTGELAELESKILSAQEKLIEREKELFASISKYVNERSDALRELAEWMATLDVSAALADVAQRHDYVRPTIDDSGEIKIAGGRHPVVERTLTDGRFVPNDTDLSTEQRQVLLITGPNMAGKSTYMRQVAQIVLLGQMGSFVPVDAATIGIVDRIFTRVGAVDDVATGESTFMVEMRETSAIVAKATPRSLVILDEVGRGTSTFDGVSIAWAVTEYLHDAIGARTLFATHYHELADLEQRCPRLHNLAVAVREYKKRVVFLHQVVAGRANRSYGIDVARLAGLPSSVLARAKQILTRLEAGKALSDNTQLAFFDEPTPPSSQIEQALMDIDLNNIKPLDLVQMVAAWQEELKQS